MTLAQFEIPRETFPLPTFDTLTQVEILSSPHRCAICGGEFEEREMLVEQKALPTYPPGEIVSLNYHYGCHMWRKVRQ